MHHEPEPLQMYGRQKLAGERAVLAARDAGANVASLRVPVLYGPAEYNAESAVNILVESEPARARSRRGANMPAHTQSSATSPASSTRWTITRSATRPTWRTSRVCCTIFRVSAC